jgi:carbon storage regulator
MEDKTMLVLSRRVGETIHIDGQIKVTIVKVRGNCVKVGIEAPDEVRIVRSELGEWSELSFDRHSPSKSEIRPNFMALTSGWSI